MSFNFKQLKEKALLLFLLDVILLVAPGIAILFIFFRDIFLSLDWVKLILLSISITAPFTFLNMLLVPELDKDYDPNRKDEFFYGFSIAATITGLFFYMFLPFSYLYNWGAGQLFQGLVTVELLFLIIIFFKSTFGWLKRKFWIKKK
ncbi:MAG: hypothetical protein WC113_01155 [Candidatus Paceibacterota bacterium]|jgi:hypothetical protein